MILAGHFPTRQFTHAEWLAMPVEPERQKGYPLDPGLYRARDDRGKPIVLVIHDWNHWKMSHAVRPLVRVRKGAA